ncbi:hypothetical protein AYJ57_24430 (plasmid) [Salipiger sp. CCB-MM3]|uniref:surface lipoprotein assembly modifier n=1 Tax=Salipiger sp. CCB-MM3 TaxID=1792508 RepID=UPI00080AAEBF|nr:tetratricopeptide repeat protein [Salipiger sp. CCB-MM3]ANT63628.1 hypothetical protein AYJ57_24430 [Salipiger sp. CCB-MM3]
MARIGPRAAARRTVLPRVATLALLALLGGGLGAGTARAQDMAPAATPEASPEVAPAQIEARFQQAMTTRDPEAAVRLLRRILAQDPGLVRVRLELARALFEAGQYARSREQFRIVLSSPDLPPQVRDNVLRFMRAIDEKRGWRAEYSIGLRAPRGAGRSYDTDTFDFDLGDGPLPFVMNRPDPPLTGLALSGAARRQWPLATRMGGATLTAYLRGAGEIYETEGDIFDEASAELAAGLQFTWPRSTAYLELLAGTDYDAWEMTEERLGLGAGISWRSASGLTTALEAELMDVTLGGFEGEDVTRASASATVIKPLGGRAQIAASLSLQHQAAWRDDLSYDYAELRFGGRTEVSGGFLLEPSVYALAFEQVAAGAGFSETRSEREYGLELRIDKTDTFVFGRLTPYVEIAAARRNSSIDAYSYRELRIGAGLSSAF